MPELAWIVVAGLLVLIAFFAGGILFRRLSSQKIAKAEEYTKKIVAEAEKEAEMKKKEALLEAKDEWFKAKTNFEREITNRRSEQAKSEKKVEEREQSVERKADLVNKKERDLSNKEKVILARDKALETREQELEKLVSDQNRQLERISGMSSEEARRQLMDNLVNQARAEAAGTIKQIKEEAEATADREAKNIVISAIQRSAADHAVETTVSVVHIPSDDMKGRIIGREGRNIRAFETLTGVDVIVDDTPEAVILSGFDPVRREVAKMALEKLIADGRIHPARIEEVVAKAEKEMEVIIREAGEQACFDVGVHGIHSEIIKLLGKLKFRTSYGQNVLEHSKEVAWLCGLMAAQLGLDGTMAKRAGLLHDVGKAIDRETEGTHTQIGATIASKHNEPAAVINAIASHHQDVIQETPYSVLVQAADSISGARPGARRESLENYIKRLEKLEEVADSFKGVAKAYAIQAGREIRIMVENEQVDDSAAVVLASDIAKKIQQELEYPGQIKVTVIRETRAIDYAK